MPELPEVETIKIGLQQLIVGKKIKQVEVRFPKILQGDTSKIIGAKFKTIRRFGKALSLDLNNGFSIVIHVKMTGQLIYKGKVGKVERVESVESVESEGDLPHDVLPHDVLPHDVLPHKHTHVIFHLNEGMLFYNDIRKFGWLKIIPTPDVEKMSFIKSLGPEPFVTKSSSRQALTIEKFNEILKNKSTKIKVLIMDQTKIGGVGNIYANDALFLAGIHPERKASSLSLSETLKLLKALETVLKAGIKYGGSSENTYLNALGERGSYQEHSLVYGKKGKSCPKCKTPIQMLRLGGRGTFFCPICQK